ncbi:MAG: mannosyltransferase family protein [Gammaproteobacteria bacterium]|nr:mannosyltransferase family protein [Gammaproteobacteria bacterium]
MKSEKAFPFLLCLFIFLCSRVAIYSFAYLINEYAHLGLAPQSWFVHWDSGWYLNIAAQGYNTSPIVTLTQTFNYPFFPLYPMLIKGASFISPFSSMANGQMMSQFFFLLSLILFYFLLKQYFNQKISLYGLILLAFSPFNIYFSSVYTESLYLFLSLSAWLSMLKKKWLLVGLFGFFLALTRPTGIILLLPALLAVFEDFKQGRYFQIRYLYLALIPFGLILYMAYLGHHMGDPLAFMHAEHAWGRNNYRNIQGWLILLHYSFFIRPIDALFFLLSIFLFVKLWIEHYIKEALFFFTPLLLCIDSASFTSIARYASCTFIFYFALILISRKSTLKQVTFICISATLLPIYILCWLSNTPHFN